MKAWKVDSSIDGLGDMVAGALKAQFEQDPEKKKELFMNWVTNDFVRFLTIYEKRIEENGNDKYLVGDSITTADFAFAGIIFNIIYNELNPSTIATKPIFENFPHLKAYAEHLSTNDLKEHLEKRPKLPFWERSALIIDDDLSNR